MGKMGVHEDIKWLETNKDGWSRVFKLIASEGNMGFRKIKDFYGVVDWWPVKTYVRRLVERGLISEDKGMLSLTEQGKKVSETLKTFDLGDV